MKAPNKHFNKFIKTLALLPALVLLAVLPAQAQRVPGMVGVGGQFGDQSGLSLKFYNPNQASADFLAAWDFDERVFLDGHAVFEQHIGRRGTAHFFYGPGGFVEFRDRPNDEEDDVGAGISAKVGLGFMINTFEIYGHLTPRLFLTPATNGDIGGGVGFRIYF
jgi:hypothetical protein